MRLGDLVEKITTYTGIKWLVKKITKMIGLRIADVTGEKNN